MKELRVLGLTEGEVKVYETLFQIGPSTNTPIARHAGLQSSTVYYCLNSLSEKGLVTYIIKGGRKQYRLNNPEQLTTVLDKQMHNLKERKKALRPLIEKIKAKKQEQKTTTEVYEGWKGIQSIFQNIRSVMKRGETYHAFVIEETLEDPQKVRFILLQHNRALKEKGIKVQLLAHESARKTLNKAYGEAYLKHVVSLRYTKEHIPTGITIYKEKVITHINDRGKLMAVKISNKALAESYRKHFNSLWEKAK